MLNYCSVISSALNLSDTIIVLVCMCTGATWPAYQNVDSWASSLEILCHRSEVDLKNFYF